MIRSFVCVKPSSLNTFNAFNCERTCHFCVVESL